MAVFKYINMPKLVAFYLKEFSVKKSGVVSTLYKFVFCLCLPFISRTFARARANYLAIASCTDSIFQIIDVIEALTGANLYQIPMGEELYSSYDGTNGDDPFITYDDTDSKPKILYTLTTNVVILYCILNDANKQDVLDYLKLLIPFYVQLSIVWSDEAAPPDGIDI